MIYFKYQGTFCSYEDVPEFCIFITCETNRSFSLERIPLCPHMPTLLFLEIIACKMRANTQSQHVAKVIAALTALVILMYY